ncbi:nucleotidyl transferase AbiEii/AbiGii toxin family protein [Rhodospira trueperi]|uniref:Nucleotidyl transferase AbiEii toxin, Type IV TA system n=1 Tax=Rhodospira trueperi TaxID=69960 RepID=A0A1G7DVF1_9PROT|nr:nucleotidyl transferase AbiEii/AbiGii toxin family protein [Rhodospira trueperi]SDE55477.1 Nucleotidyl transferase AbiEii toxin, Type IV TA system [Rhodospira trueperi]
MIPIDAWVTADPGRTTFRQAVHIVLTAIAGTESLRTTMALKGGMLMALAFGSSRYTKDIDFSTRQRLSAFDLDRFRTDLDAALRRTSDSLGYPILCAVRTCKQQPPGADRTHPTIRASVGYARRGNVREMRRLGAGQATTVIHVDHSLNEVIGTEDIYTLDEHDHLRTYGLVDLVSEKLRATLQQKSEARDRTRRQDIYDIHFLLRTAPERFDARTRADILRVLVDKARSRSLDPKPSDIADPEIRARSAQQYDDIAMEIEEPLPPFDVAYEAVRTFYESLPWSTDGTR